MTQPWKYTISVQRSEERSDGSYIVGEASGVERDTKGTEMAPEAIVGFARQITERVQNGDPLPYRDSHAKDGVLMNLGHVMSADVTPDFHLRVAVRLDTENPAADYLFKSVQRGKQYGMSIAGSVGSFQMVRDQSGGRVVRFTEVQLKEISNTTSPSWVPSFGTVLARSVESEEDQTGEIQMSTPAVVETPATAAVVETSEIDRARIAQVDQEAVIAAFTGFGQTLAGLGIAIPGFTAAAVVPAETVTTPTTPENTSVENSDTGDSTVDFHGVQIERSAAETLTTFIGQEIEKATTQLTAQIVQRDAYIAQLIAMPAGKIPAGVIRDKFESDTPTLPAFLTDPAMSTDDKLRAALNAMTSDVRV